MAPAESRAEHATGPVAERCLGARDAVTADVDVTGDVRAQLERAAAR